MSAKSTTYLVIAYPPSTWPVKIDSMRVIDVFATTGSLAHAREIAIIQRADYAAAFGEACYLRVVKADNAGDFLATE